MKILISIFILFASLQAKAYQKKIALKGGGNLTFNYIKTFKRVNDRFLGGGFNTHLGYRWVDWELNLTSTIVVGKLESFTFNVNELQVSGQGTLRQASFGPTLKYFTNYSPAPTWRLYLGAGPLAALQTVKFDSFTASGGEFKEDYKATFNSWGYQVMLGMEEFLPIKTMRPVYVELVFSYLRSYEISIVDASDHTQVRTLQTKFSNQQILGQTLSINFGMTFF